MLQETDTEDTRLFCHIFIIGSISIGGLGPGPLPGYAYGGGFNTALFIAERQAGKQ